MPLSNAHTWLNHMVDLYLLLFFLGYPIIYDDRILPTCPCLCGLYPFSWGWLLWHGSSMWIDHMACETQNKTCIHMPCFSLFFGRLWLLAFTHPRQTTNSSRLEIKGFKYHLPSCVLIDSKKIGIGLLKSTIIKRKIFH